MPSPDSDPTKLFIAFDIGTVYSRVSYCFRSGRPAEVLDITKFPAQGAIRPDARVPSILYYDESGVARAVGTDVLTEDVMEIARTQGWTRAEWWKLHLCPKSLVRPGDKLPPLPCGKSVVDILADFIKYLFDASRAHILGCHPMCEWTSIEHSISYILTYPGGWGEQQCLYRLAIERAGLVPSSPLGQSRVHLLTEGEACLHFYTPRYLFRTTNQATPSSIVVIDAGGGTIDLSTFSMSSDQICRDVAPAECQLQGSIFVTQRANALLQRKLQGWEHSSATDIARFTREFDRTTKLAIESDHETAYIRVAGRRTNSPGYCISSGKLRLSGKEATGLFNDSIDVITSAFEHQQQFATTPITMVLLVGGLSTNDWLWSRIRSYFTDRDINACRPNIHIDKAVANGAILSQLERIRAGAIVRDKFGPNPARMPEPTKELNLVESFLRTKRNANGPDIPEVQHPTRKSTSANGIVVMVDGTPGISSLKETSLGTPDLIGTLEGHVKLGCCWLVGGSQMLAHLSRMHGFRLQRACWAVGPGNLEAKQSAIEFKMNCCWSPNDGDLCFPSKAPSWSDRTESPSCRWIGCNQSTLMSERHRSSANYEIHRDAVVTNEPRLFVPQTICQPHARGDMKRCVSLGILHPPIIFVAQGSSEWGVPVQQLLSKQFRLVDGNEPAFPSCEPSIRIRLQWPGYQQFQKHIQTRDHTLEYRMITKAKLAMLVAKCVNQFMDAMSGQPMEVGSDGRWRVGPPNIQVDDIILVSLHHVSQGSWQPQLCLRRTITAPDTVTSWAPSNPHDEAPVVQECFSHFTVS